MRPFCFAKQERELEHSVCCYTLRTKSWAALNFRLMSIYPVFGSPGVQLCVQAHTSRIRRLRTRPPSPQNRNGRTHSTRRRVLKSLNHFIRDDHLGYSKVPPGTHTHVHQTNQTSSKDNIIIPTDYQASNAIYNTAEPSYTHIVATNTSNARTTGSTSLSTFGRSDGHRRSLY